MKSFDNFCSERECDSCLINNYSDTRYECESLYNLALQNKGKVKIDIDISKEIED